MAQASCGLSINGITGARAMELVKARRIQQIVIAGGLLNLTGVKVRPWEGRMDLRFRSIAAFQRGAELQTEVRPKSQADPRGGWRTERYRKLSENGCKPFPTK
jgi:hypothetical protein